MCSKDNSNKHFLLMLITLAWFMLFCLVGCGGGGGGGGGGDGEDSDDGGSLPSYSERDVSFGGVVLYHFADKSITLMNAGSVNLPLGQIEYPALPFAIVNDECSGRTLAPSGTCDIQIRFSPTDQGDHEGFFAVPLTGSSTNFVGVNLDGIGHGLNVSINQVSTENCKTIKLIVSVTDESDNFVKNLTESNFSLIEGVSAVPETATPDTTNLSVVLALDSSGSVFYVLPQIRDAAKAFVGDLNENDEVAVFQFSDSPEEKIGFTAIPDGTADIEAAIDTITNASGYTALYDALIYVCDYFDTAPIPAFYERRAIVIITDGEDTSSGNELENAIADAQDTGIPIFTIGLGTDNAEVLQTLADDTGGQYYDAPTEDILDTIYPQIAELLTNQYLIEYTSNSYGGANVSVNLGVEYNDGTTVWTGEDTREFVGCP